MSSRSDNGNGSRLPRLLPRGQFPRSRRADRVARPAGRGRIVRRDARARPRAIRSTCLAPASRACAAPTASTSSSGAVSPRRGPTSRSSPTAALCRAVRASVGGVPRSVGLIPGSSALPRSCSARRSLRQGSCSGRRAATGSSRVTFPPIRLSRLSRRCSRRCSEARASSAFPGVATRRQYSPPRRRSRVGKACRSPCRRRTCFGPHGGGRIGVARAGGCSSRAGRLGATRADR